MVAPELPLAQEAEKHRLNDLAAIGYDYRELEIFVHEEEDMAFMGLGDSPDLADTPSLYRRALASGISEVLSSYRGAVLKVEQDVLNTQGAVMALARVQASLSEFAVVLPQLHRLLIEVRAGDLRGGLLLQHLHQRGVTGVLPLQPVMHRLLWHCHQVWYKQLEAWMVHGMLLDQGKELFIVKNSRAARSDAQELPPDTSTSEWHNGFRISLEMLPACVMLPVAETILFIGRAVRVLRRPSKKFLGNNREGVLLLPEDDMQQASAALAKLQAAPQFHRISFERTVESIRAMVARHLWKLVVEEADLLGHMQALKDYYLLAKGDFFQFLFEDSKSIMALPPRASSQADLNVPFQQSAIRSSAASDKHFELVKLRLAAPQTSATDLRKGGAPSTESAGEGSEIELGPGMDRGSTGDPAVDRIRIPKYDGWDALSLDYRVEWPLGLLITPAVLRRYNTVFQYLVRLKRLQLELEESWALMRIQRKSPSHGGRSRLMNLRQQMAHLITNLQIYFQVDVIEAEYKVLQDKVAAAHDFSEVERAHHQYLSALLSQTFLDVSLVSQTLANIIEQCLQLCRLIKLDDGSANAAAANPLEVEDLFERFLKFSNTLYTCFRSNRLAGSARAPFLRQLLLRLNYNSFYSDEAARRLMMHRPSSAASAMQTPMQRLSMTPAKS